MSDSYNVADALLAANLPARADKTAFIDDRGRCSFAELDRGARAFAGYLLGLGLPIETRILILLEDSIAYPIACLGAIRAGLVPVMVNPLLTSADLAFMLDDARARLVIASPSVWPRLEPILAERPFLQHVLVDAPETPAGARSLAEGFAHPHGLHQAARTRRDDACLWQYSSGSTGRPKGTIHTHGAVADLTDLYPREILSIDESDITFSAAKLFFGYGFGNGMIFPLTSGATAILMAERPTAAAVWERLLKHRPTIFYGVPTLYNSMLSYPDLPSPDMLNLRLCTSAGEALPAEIGLRWRNRFGTDILDGIGSTEMLHIFLTNKPDDVCYGTTGTPVQSFDIRLLDDAGQPVPQGEIGELHVRGPTSAAGYWCNREKTQSTFLGPWVRSGDKFFQDENGRYVYCGRGDDMLKVSGIYVSPLEVEAALLSHSAVAEAAVIGWPDEAGLIKPKAFVVLDGCSPSNDLVEELKAYVKSSLAPYKYPRWIEFMDALPTTATGKIARFRLRK